MELGTDCRRPPRRFGMSESRLTLPSRTSSTALAPASTTIWWFAARASTAYGLEFLSPLTLSRLRRCSSLSTRATAEKALPLALNRRPTLLLTGRGTSAIWRGGGDADDPAGGADAHGLLALALALAAAAAGIGHVDGAVVEGDTAGVVEAGGDGLDRGGLSGRGRDHRYGRDGSNRREPLAERAQR